jgi:hypothetical protein
MRRSGEDRFSVDLKCSICAGAVIRRSFYFRVAARLEFAVPLPIYIDNIDNGAPTGHSRSENPRSSLRIPGVWSAIPLVGAWTTSRHSEQVALRRRVRSSGRQEAHGITKLVTQGHRQIPDVCRVVFDAGTIRNKLGRTIPDDRKRS